MDVVLGDSELPKGAEVIGLVTPETGPTGMLIRPADGNYSQGNAGELRNLPRRSVEKAIAAAKAAETQAKSQAKSKPRARKQKPLRP